MDTWRSQWIAEEADVSFPQIEPSYEECDVNNPNLLIGSIEISGDDQNKIETNSLKPTFKTASLAKRRLQAFSASKQLKRYPSKDEKIEDGDKSDKNFGTKKSKKALYPDDKAKAVIREIEEIKRTENVHKRVELNPETVAAAMKNVSSFNIQRARSRSLSADRETRFKRREKRRRNYRQSDSITQKSVSPEDLARKSEKTSSHKLMYPSNWAEYKQQGLTVVKDEDLKLKLFPRKKINKLEFFDKIYNFDAPSPIIDSFSCSANEEKVEIPFTFVRVTRSRPHVTYCVNFREIKESFLTRNQLFQIIPRERRHLIETLFSTNSKVQPTKKKMISQQWYNKAWKKIGDVESSIFEKSVGLSFLQNYSDEEEDNDAEEIIICSSTKKKDSEEIITVESNSTHVDKRNDISDEKKLLIFDTNEKKKDGIKSVELDKIFEEKQYSSRNILKDEEKKLKNIILKEKKDNINLIGKKSTDKGKQDVPQNIDAEERKVTDIFDLEDNMKSQINLGGHKSGEIGKGKQDCKKNILDTGEKDKTINSAAVKTTEKSEAELISSTISENKKSMKKHIIDNEEKEIEYTKPRTPQKKDSLKEHVLDIEKTEFVPLEFPEEKNDLPYRSDGELTPEESFQINKIQKDELNETKKAIKELEAELERRQSIKLDVNDEKSKKKKKKKKAKVNRKEDSSDSEDDSDTEPSKSRKKQRRSKRRKQKKYSEEESSSSSTEDEKRKRKKTKKKTRYIKDKTSKKKVKNKKTELQVKESKTKKKDEYPEEKAGNIESKKKKKRFSENQVSEESDTTILSGKHKKKKKKKTKRQYKETSDEDTDSDEDVESKTEKESANLKSSKDSNRKLLKKKRKRSDTEVEQIIESEKEYEENTAKSRNYEITSVPSAIIKTSRNASEMDKGEKVRDSEKIERKRKSSRDNFDKIDETVNRNEDMYAIKFHEKEYHEKIGEKLYSEIGSYKKFDFKFEVGRGKTSRDKSENLENKESNRKSRERKRSCSLEKGNKGTPKSTEKYDHKEHLKKIQLNNIKLEPNWESLQQKRNKHKDDTLGLEKPPINVNLDDEFPLAGLAAKGTSEKCDIRTPDTDDYRANWEKEAFPVWESEDEVTFKPKGNNINNTCWESDEEVFERRHRSPEKQRPFNDSFDLEIPLNIKPFKKREIIDADAELQRLKIEGQNLTEERRQFEIEKLKVKQLELTVAQGVADRGQEQQQHLSPIRKTKDEHPKDRFDIEVDKPKRGRWDKKIPVGKVSTQKIDIIDLTKGTPTKLFEDENFTDNSSSASLNNSSAVLENEYEEFIKAVSSTISPKANSPKGHKQIETKNASFGINFSDFSDSNSSLEILRIKKISNTEKKSCQRKLSMIDDLPAVTDPLQTLILPKDIPFIPMPNEIKPVPVPSPQVDVQKIPTNPVINLSLSANITLDVTTKIDSPTTQKSLDVIKPLPTVQVPILLPPAPTNQARELQNQSEDTVSSTSIVTPSTQVLNEKTSSITCVTATVPVGTPQKQIEHKVSETVVNFASPLTDVSIDSNLFEEKTQTKGEKLFNFTSIVLPSKKLLIGNTNLKLDDSDDEIDQNKSLKKLEQIKKENTLIAASLTGDKEKETVQMETVQEKEHAKVTEHPRSRSPIVKSHSRDIDNVDVMMRTRSQEKPPSPKRRRRDSSPRRRDGSPRRREWSPRRRDDSPRRRDDSPRRRTGSPRRKAGSPRRRIGSPRRRDMSPRRRSRSPRRSSPRMRKSSPVKRRYSSRWSKSPSRRRSISPRRRSPRNLSPRTSLSRRMRSKSPEKSKFTGSYQQFAEMLKPKSPPAITSPLDGLKRSVADSTISDDSLLPQLNMDEYTESPVSRYYERIVKMPESPKRMPLDVRINQELGYGKQENKPKNMPYDIYNFEKSYVSQSHQFNKNEMPQKSVCLNARFPVLQNTFVQVGNMVQIVPTDMMDIKTERAVPEKAPPEALNEYKDTILEKEAVFHVIESKALQVGNVIEIVPKESPKELPKQSPKQLPKESPKHLPKETLKELPKNSPKELHIESPEALYKESPKVLHKESPKGLNKESPKGLHKESPKGIHKESPKESPKALPKDSPKELPKETPKDFLKESLKVPRMPVVLKKEPEESVNTISVQEKQSAEVAMKLKVAERRAEREHRRQERENRRKEKEKRRREKEKQRQIKMKEKTENMIKRALQLEVEGLEDEASLLNSTPTQWPPLPALPSSSKDIGRSIMIRGGARTRDSKLDIKKIVQFADGIKPGEGTSPSAGEELSSPRTPIKLPKEKRYKKTKFSKKLQKKKKVKVKIIKNLQADSDGEEDFLPPPSPPPGSPPPHVFPPRVKTPTINNIHPYLPNLLTVQPNPIQQLFRPPLSLLMAPPPMHHHGARPRHHVPPPTIHHHGQPPPGPPHHHGPPPAGPPMHIHGPLPPPGPPHHHGPPPGPPGPLGPHHRPPPYHF